MDNRLRIQKLEAQIARLQQQLTRGVSRKSLQYPPGARIAKVTLDPGSGATFGITFQDGEYLESSGSSEAIFSDRQSSQVHWCQNLLSPGTRPPEDSIIPVWENRGQWWTIWKSQTTPVFRWMVTHAARHTFPAISQDEIRPANLSFPIVPYGPPSTVNYGAFGCNTDGSGFTESNGFLLIIGMNDSGVREAIEQGSSFSNFQFRLSESAGSTNYNIEIFSLAFDETIGSPYYNFNTSPAFSSFDMSDVVSLGSFVVPGGATSNALLPNLASHLNSFFSQPTWGDGNIVPIWYIADAIESLANPPATYVGRRHQTFRLWDVADFGDHNSVGSWEIS